MDFIKDNDELTIDPSAIRVKSHTDVTTDRDRIVTTIDSSNITVIQREVRNTVDNDIASLHVELRAVVCGPGHGLDETGGCCTSLMMGLLGVWWCW